MTEASQSPTALLAHLRSIPMTEWVWSDAEMIFATLEAAATTAEAGLLRERIGLDDADNLVASGEDLDWLIQQLIRWPTRVHPERTTNDRFLRQSAALTLAALQTSAPGGGK